VCELDEVGTIQVWSKIQVHGEEGGHEMMIKCSTWKRRKRNKTQWRLRQRYYIEF
jgi:hypothetical protein